MPFSLSEVPLDPDMGQAVTILRSQGAFVSGGFLTTGPPQQIPTWGIIEIDQDQLDRMIPEGDRISGAIGLYITLPIYTTRLDTADGAPAPAISDEIQWNNHRYSVTSVGPWGDFGYYFAVLLRLAGT